MSIYRLVSLLVTTLSILDFTYNIVRVDNNPPLHTMSAFIFCSLGAAFFGAGLIWDRPWLRIGQLILMYAVSMLTIAFNSIPLIGFFFLFISIAVTYAYDFLDTHRVLKIFGISVVIYLSFFLIYGDLVKSLLTFLGVDVACSLVGYILYDKVRRMKNSATEAIDIARGCIELSKELEHGDRTGKN